MVQRLVLHIFVLDILAPSVRKKILAWKGRNATTRATEPVIIVKMLHLRPFVEEAKTRLFMFYI